MKEYLKDFNWVQIANFLALLVGGLYFIFSLEKSNELLAQKLETIDSKLEAHSSVYAHPGAREDIQAIARSVDGLLRVSEYHGKEIERLRDDS